MLRGLELQFRTRSRLTQTAEGEALAIQFRFGPIAIFIIANMPEYEGENGEAPLAYIKVNLAPNEDWTVFKEHTNGTKNMSKHSVRKG